MRVRCGARGRPCSRTQGSSPEQARRAGAWPAWTGSTRSCWPRSRPRRRRFPAGCRSRTRNAPACSLAEDREQHIAAVRLTEGTACLEPDGGDQVLVLRASRFELLREEARLYQVVHGFGGRPAAALVRAATDVVAPVVAAVRRAARIAAELGTLASIRRA